MEVGSAFDVDLSQTRPAMTSKYGLESMQAVFNISIVSPLLYCCNSICILLVTESNRKYIWEV